MQSSEVRKKFLEFFKKRGHTQIPSSKLVPENDPTTLFTSAGMQPLLPYILSGSHPEGNRLVDSQKCFRSQDIEEVGDTMHDTFFEMLGNWSLGDYWKEEQLSWFFEFLTNPKDGLGLDPNKLYPTVFEGINEIPQDDESIQIWQRLFKEKNTEAKPGEKIHLYGVEKNWWSRSGPPEQMPAGEPGGPSSEVFYEFTDIPHNPDFGESCHPNCECGRFLEIGNSVLMQYQKQEDGSFKELPKKTVDFGGGLERLTAATQNDPDIFKTDLFWPIIERLEEKLGTRYDESEKAKTTIRVIADHIKAATFLIKDGVFPSNKLQGYVLRRLLRRAAVKINSLKENSMDILPKLVDPVLDIYSQTEYFQTGDWDKIRTVVEDEINKFQKTLNHGLKEINKIESIDSKKAFDLYQSFGFPIEITAEIFEEKGQKINLKQFQNEIEKHKELSRTTSAGVFKGGLADQKEATTKLHTANHLLQAALKKIIGNHIGQRGSNITAERLRFDFNHDQKLTDEQLKQVEDLVNEQIQKDLPVHFDIEDKDEAIKNGALTNYGETYPQKVKVYKIGTEGNYFSMELCGGPHVEHTALIKKFKIQKEESAGSGIRRIYAIVED